VQGSAGECSGERGARAGKRGAVAAGAATRALHYAAAVPIGSGCRVRHSTPSQAHLQPRHAGPALWEAPEHF
jgi:hypothetical protein